MKIIVIGGTGTIGSQVVNILNKDHEVITVGNTKGDYRVDIECKDSLEKLFAEIGPVDGIISATGGAYLGTLAEITDEQLDLAINSKIRGQINIMRTGIHTVKENGFITVTSGTASHDFMPGASSISMSTAALNTYVKAIQLEKYKGIRINAVSPGFVTETAQMMHIEYPNTISAADTALAYKMLVDSDDSGLVVEVADYLTSLAL